ncbi:MAG: AAA family ATPase [Pseudonocardia sp.]|nr:AAA family ATPase [Pseudonocardia sp.]
MAGLLERDTEMARIAHVLTRSAGGVGGVVAVCGPAGIGKTSLLAAARDAARRQGARVLRARGAELEREFGFGVVRQLFEPLLAAASADERAEWLAGAAGRAAGLLGMPGAGSPPTAEAEAPDRSFLVPHGLYWLCVQLSATGPVCLVVDDAQWTDHASRRFLAFLLPRLEELPLTVLLAVRTGEGSAERWITKLDSFPGAELVEPSPLSPEAVERLLAAGLGTVPDPCLAVRCHRATGGVPFLVEQLVRALREDGVTPAAVEGVDSIGGRAVERWVRLRIGRLGEPAARLARAVAILESASLQPAADLADLGPQSAVAASDALRGAGILAAGRPLSFAHPIVRRAVYDEIGEATRAAAHRRAAHLLAASGAAEEQVAEHLLAAEPAGDPWVVDRLSAAATAATGRGASESAAAYLRRALAEPPPPQRRSALLLDLGRAEFNAGHPDAFPHLEQSVATAMTGEGRAAAAVAFAFALGYSDNRFGRSVRVLDETRASLGAEDKELSLSLETMAMSLAILDADVAPAHRARIRAARRRADAPRPSRRVLALAGMIAAQRNEQADVAAELARRALRADVEPLPQRWRLPPLDGLQIASTLQVTEHGDEALPVLDRLLREARASADANTFSRSLAIRALGARMRGDVRSAEADARTALETEGMTVPDLSRVLNSAHAIEALTEQGRLEEAEGLLAPLVEAVGTATFADACLCWSRGRLRLAQHRPAEALADFVRTGDVTTRFGHGSPTFTPWRSQAALACLALGERERARRFADDELGRARTFGTPRALGVALTAVGVTHGGSYGEQALREAIRLLTRAGADLDRAWALYELGARLRRDNHRADSREPLREALDIAHRLGAGLLADRAETELRATGARPRRVVLSGVDALTASERRTAEMAAQGLTNREIGQALFVTARTVEGHLTAVFRKLDVASRDQLPSVLEPITAGRRPG